MMETSKLKLSRFFALTLAFVMCFASIALANDSAPSSSGPIPTPGAVTIRKILRMPTGTTTPTTTFEFEAEAISLDGATTTEALASMPNLNLNTGNMTVSISSADTATEDQATSIKSIAKDTGDIFAGADFPHAGVYVYEIKEIKDTNDEIDTNADEELTYSDVVYTLRVYVANNQEYTDTVISAISIIIKGQAGDQGQEVKVGQIAFTNDYIKTNGPEDPDKPNPLTESTFDISKTVTGDLGNREQYFDFTITPGIHAFDTSDRTFFRAYIVENNEVVKTITDNAAGTATGSDGNSNPYIQISTTGSTSFKLKHGQKLVFVDTPIGTSYTVNEAAAPDYIANYVITGAQSSSSNNTAPNTAVSTGIQFIGEDTNIAAFTNARESVVPTGININDLPFIGLIALPILALIGFVAFKARKRNQAS